MVKRVFDIAVSLTAIVILLPLLIILATVVLFDSKGGIFYFQKRIGKDKKEFTLFKFRTMHGGADKKGLITVGTHDSRITKSGLFLRKYKLDELPQLLNVFLGSMSMVGPRPEVKKYVDLYNSEQLKVLSVKPGLTDYSSIEYINENEMLGKAENPEYTYINEIMPNKLDMNLKYIKEQSFTTDIKILFATLKRIVSG